MTDNNTTLKVFSFFDEQFIRLKVYNYYCFQDVKVDVKTLVDAWCVCELPSTKMAKTKELSGEHVTEFVQGENIVLSQWNDLLCSFHPDGSIGIDIVHIPTKHFKPLTKGMILINNIHLIISVLKIWMILIIIQYLFEY